MICKPVYAIYDVSFYSINYTQVYQIENMFLQWNLVMLIDSRLKMSQQCAQVTNSVSEIV